MQITCQSRSRTCNTKWRSRRNVHVIKRRAVVHAIIHVSRGVVHAIISYNKFKAFYGQYETPIWSLSTKK